MKRSQVPSVLWAGLFGLGVAGGCDLPSAGFGRACDVDADCANLDSSDALRCFIAEGATDGHCLTGAAIDALLADPTGPDPTGGSCADALPLPLFVTVNGTTSGALNSHDGSCGGNAAADVVYRMELTEPSNLRVRLNASFQALLYAHDDVACVRATEIDGSCSTNPDPDTDELVMNLPGVGPGTIYIVVDGQAPGLGENAGTFNIRVETVEDGCPVGFLGHAGRCLGIQKEVTQVVARTNATATLLSDGRVLVLGGRTGANLTATNSAELFDPDTDTFTAAAPMRTARARHAAARMDDGRVLVAGGVDASGTATNTVEVYAPDTNTWVDAPPLPRRRDLLSVTNLEAGRGVVVVGGRDGSTTLGDVLVLDNALTAWTAHGTLSQPRFGHVALLMDNGDRVMLLGGRTGTNQRALDSVESFDPRNNTIDILEDLVDPRAAACGALLSQTRVMLFGGYEGNADDGFLGSPDAYLYTTDGAGGGTWKEITEVMSTPRLFATANTVPRLGIVVVGGSDPDDEPIASIDLFEEGNDGTFTPLPPLRHARLAHAAVTLVDGRVLVVGGDGGDASTTVPLAAAELIGPP